MLVFSKRPSRRAAIENVRLSHTEFRQSNFQRIIIQRLLDQRFISKMQGKIMKVYIGIYTGMEDLTE